MSDGELLRTAHGQVHSHYQLEEAGQRVDNQTVKEYQTNT